MNKTILISALFLASHSALAIEDPGPGSYICDIKISSSHTNTVVLPESAAVIDQGDMYTVHMLGNTVNSPQLETVMGGVKQQATINGITFYRRAKYDERFIIENSKSGFFYKLRNCQKQD